jgi:hypothetical protein
LPAGVGAEARLEALPGKAPLIKLSYRPPNYETPMEYLRTAITPNDAFFVRYHLSDIPQVDAAAWSLGVGGDAANGEVRLGLDELKRLPATEVVAVCQCSGNRRGLFVPHVPGVEYCPARHCPYARPGKGRPLIQADSRQNVPFISDVAAFGILYALLRRPRQAHMIGGQNEYSAAELPFVRDFGGRGGARPWRCGKRRVHPGCLRDMVAPFNPRLRAAVIGSHLGGEQIAPPHRTAGRHGQHQPACRRFHQSDLAA